MTKTLRYYPIFLFFYGIGLGVSTNLSWLPFFGFLIGLVIMSIGWMIWIPLNRRRKMRARRPQLELLLDEMIRLVEHPARLLEKIVVYNTSRQSGDKIVYYLQVRVDAQSYSLQTSTTTVGHHAGWMYVCAAQYDFKGKGKADLRLDYPDLASFARPEPWLIERLEKLRSLVGNVSLYETRRQALKKVGITIGKDDDTDPPVAA